jgi:hypothetical protein
MMGLDETSGLREPRLMCERRRRWFGLLAIGLVVGVGASCGGSSCGCLGPSPYVARTVAPDETTGLGFSANEVKAHLAGPWVGILAWVADPALVTALPATGTTTVTVALRYAFDERPITVHEPSDAYTDASASLLYMELPVHLLLSTADGALAEDHQPLVVATSASEGTISETFGDSRGIPVLGTYTATAVNAARYLATEHELKIELTPNAATGSLMLLGMGTEKSADGRTDHRIWDELSVATFTAAAVVDTGDADGGTGPADGAVSVDGGASP